MSVEVEPSDTIQSVKEKIQAYNPSFIDPTHRLVYIGKDLQDTGRLPTTTLKRI